MSATIQVLRKVQPKLRWIPHQGEQTTAFLERKRKELGGGDNDPLELVLLEARTILGRCVPPTSRAGTDTGLVIGYVQSGKTLSFTALMALARDNGYRLVVVIAGIATNLKSQSERRLAKDLGLDEAERAWVHFENPSLDKGDARSIQNALDMLSDPRMPPHKRRAVVVTVLKNHTRLGNLVAVLGQLKLSGVPTLVIDDEGDQASPNTKASQNRKTGRKEMSPTYEWIMKIKATLPHHTFLQYTATPQANLLIGIADVLSPSFAELLTPGSGYVGGEEFFSAHPPLVSTIPSSEIPSPTNQVRRPPASLQSALRFFLLGAAVHTLTKERGNRSMMVHPSQFTAPHEDYKTWVQKTVESWTSYLKLPPSAPAFQACAKLFEPEYKSLAATHKAIPPLRKLIDVLQAVLLDTRVVQVNSTEQGERDVKWQKNDYWILIGGQKLDRGFTVEGLTVTYMPRSIGTGNADTLQQRARFFGYKASYKGLCRVFLEQDARDAFQKYVEHESFIRKALAKFRGQPLRDWKRDFILTRHLRPTRGSVVGIDITRIALDDGWMTPGALFKNSGAVTENQRLLANVCALWKRKYGVREARTIRVFKDDRVGSPRNYLIEDVPLREMLSEFLTLVRIPDLGDSQIHTAAMFSLQEYLEKHPKSLCDVFLIGNLASQHRSLERGRINQVFQGKTPNVNDFSKVIYVGDRALKSEGKLSVHLRVFTLKDRVTAPAAGSDIPWFALHLAKNQAKDAVVQKATR